MKFAKLFDTPHGQFLAFTDTEDDKPIVVLKGEERHGILPTAILSGYDDNGDGDEAFRLRDEDFDSIDQAKAEATAAALVETLEGMFQLSAKA